MIYRIKVTKNNSNGFGKFIGRPSLFGNPFSRKKSNLLVVASDDPIKKYKTYLNKKVENQKEEITNELNILYKKLKRDQKISLDCFCIDDEIVFNETNIIKDFNNYKCHGCVIAEVLMDRIINE